MEGRVDLNGWLNTEMVYLPQAVTLRSNAGPAYSNFVDQIKRVTTTPCHQLIWQQCHQQWQQVNMPRLTPCSQVGSTRFAYLVGMEGSVAELTKVVKIHTVCSGVPINAATTWWQPNHQSNSRLLDSMSYETTLIRGQRSQTSAKTSADTRWIESTTWSCSILMAKESWTKIQN